MTDAYVLTKPPSNVLDLVTTQSIKAPPHIIDLLRRLHKKSLDQETALKQDASIEKYRSDSSIPAAERQQFFDTLMRDKFIALVPDKSIFMYNLARASDALNIVEAGTSYGVSTIYLALAVGQNAVAKGIGKGNARVIATENEAEKARQAREHWQEAGEDVEGWIELREGDLRETLKENLPEIDFVLFDSEYSFREAVGKIPLLIVRKVWTPMVMPTLRILEPKLKRGAVLLADNTLSAPEGYKDFLAHIKADGSKYTTQTLPFEDGLEMAVYLP